MPGKWEDVDMVRSNNVVVIVQSSKKLKDQVNIIINNPPFRKLQTQFTHVSDITHTRHREM